MSMRSLRATGCERTSSVSAGTRDAEHKQQQQLPLTEPLHVPGTVLTPLHTFLLLIFTTLSEVDSVMIPFYWRGNGLREI